jgi:DNA-binding transcriptional MocR family regulator
MAEEIERTVPAGALGCFSVRSAFELLFEALALEEGSEVLMSVITHTDMARIVARHGLVAVPVDLDLETRQPRADLLERGSPSGPAQSSWRTSSERAPASMRWLRSAAGMGWC